MHMRQFALAGLGEFQVNMISGQSREIDVMLKILANIFAAIEKLSLNQFRLCASLFGFTLCISSIVSIFAIPISPYSVELFPVFRVFVCVLGFGSGAAVLWYSSATQQGRRVRIARFSFRSVPIACIFYFATILFKDGPNTLTIGQVLTGFVGAILWSIPILYIVEKLLGIAIKLENKQPIET